jgi:hypothetical protein
MAVVRITKELIYEVQKNITRTMQGSIDVLAENPPDFGRQCLDKILEPYTELIGQVPPEWLLGCNSVRVCSPKRASLNYAVQCVINPPVPVPIKVPASPNYITQIYNTGEVWIWLESPVLWNEERAALEAWQRSVNKAVRDVEVAKIAAADTLNSFSTLAPALKVWPALWDLLPEETKNKHREVVTRAPKTAAPDVSASLDKLGGVTAQLTINKLKV